MPIRSRLSIGVNGARRSLFAVQTNVEVVNPHPGSTASGGVAPTASFNPGCHAPYSFGFFTTITGGVFTNHPSMAWSATRRRTRSV
jgi:hypothetical protein